MRFAILTTSYLFSHLEKMLDEHPFEHEISLHNYKDFSHIARIYEELEPQYDGFLVSGETAYYALLKSGSHPQKPVRVFNIDYLVLYSLLLKLLDEDRSLRLDHIVLDIMLSFFPDSTCREFLDYEKFTVEKQKVEQAQKYVELEEIMQIEQNVTERIYSLWKEQKIDLVLCRYSSIVPFLQENQIPFIFINPTYVQLCDSIRELKTMIEIESLKKQLAAVIIVWIKESHNTSTDEMNLNQIILHKCLLDYNKENLLNFQIQKNQNGFQIYTSLKVVSQITEQFTVCQLQKYLADHSTHHYCIGYGIGKDISVAALHAASAVKESVVSGGSFVMNENGALQGPLGAALAVISQDAFTPELKEIADRTHLSTITVQKLRTIMTMKHTSEFTCVELAEYLNVKPRNANRILNQLSDNGYAAVSSHVSNNSKGRPVKIYRLSL